MEFMSTPPLAWIRTVWQGGGLASGWDALWPRGSLEASHPGPHPGSAPPPTGPHRALPSPRPPPALAAGGTLTVAPPPMLSVTALRQFSLSVRPHLRSSASTVRPLSTHL